MDTSKTIIEDKLNLINSRIKKFKELIQPNILLEELPSDNNISNLVISTRSEISNILKKTSTKFICIVGPCSIHDIEQAKVYGRELKKISDKLSDKMLVVMRVYFEKPRTTVGWKGYINDPDLDGSFNVNKGIRGARELLIYLNSIGIPCAYEILDTITPQYISDLISWGAIGARTTESQVHRQIVSGLSMPVGFKNSTSGDINIAANAIISAKYPHCFMGITNTGVPAICETKGNEDCHIILRGGSCGPNFKESDIKKTKEILIKNMAQQSILVDCSHGNSMKNHKNQKLVLRDIVKQRLGGNSDIVGCMIESNLIEGRQTLGFPENLEYGISITDSCIGLDETKYLLDEIYALL